MAYFILDGSELNVDEIRANATTLTGAETAVFNPGQNGSYWWRIPAPQIGQVIAALPDISVLDFPGGGQQVIQDTVAWSGATLYQVSETTVGGVTTSQLNVNSSSVSQTDTVLAAKYPGAILNDNWQSLTVAPGESGGGFLNEFYLQVSGGSDFLNQVFGPLGISIPDAGRFLVTTGTITGARDAAWDNWQDVVMVGDSNSTDPNADLSSDLGPPDEVSTNNAQVYTVNNITVDDGTGTFYIDTGRGAAPSIALNSQYDEQVAAGVSPAQAVLNVLNKVASSVELGSALAAVQGVGNPYPAAWASAASQITGSVSLGDALRKFQSSLLGILEDELHNFDSGQPVDIDSRISDATARFVVDAGTALSGPLGTAFQEFTNAIGLHLGNSQPEIDAFIKYADDQNMTVLPPGHSDKYIGTAFNDKVTLNGNSVAYGAGGDDVLVSHAVGGDILDGGPGDDTLIATSGDNLLIGGPGNNTLIGGSGSDVARYDFTRSQIAITRNTDGSYMIVTPNGTDHAADIKSLQFSDGSSLTLGSAPCFAAGTRILTTLGAMSVEKLREGDNVLTISGEQRSIQWIGYRHVDCRRHIDRERVLPIRILPHAFGQSRPKRPLLLSPDHSVFVEGVLIPIKFLVNDTTITQIDLAAVSYFHIELLRHDILLAEGMPAESCLETGGRKAFENAGSVMELHPNFQSDPTSVAIFWQNLGYAPLLGNQGELDRVRQKLAWQTAMLGGVPMRRKTLSASTRRQTVRIA